MKEERTGKLSGAEVCHMWFSKIISPGLGGIRKVEIKEGRCAVQRANESELNRWNREHGSFGRSYVYDVAEWSLMDRQKFSRLVTKYQATFFVLLRREDVKILPALSDLF